MMNCLINSAEQKHLIDLRRDRYYLTSIARLLTKTILLKVITN